MGNNSSSRRSGKKGAPLVRVESNMDESQKNVRAQSPSTEDESGWILECMVVFVKSPECSIFVDGFIDENCLVFDADSGAEADTDEAVQAEWGSTHARYKEMVEALLLSHLAKLGLSTPQFTDAMHKAQSAHQSAFGEGILRYILAIDDFAVFRSIMIQRNVDLEKEALLYLQHSQSPIPMPPNSRNNQMPQPHGQMQMSEAQQLEWAMRDSLALQKSEPELPKPAITQPTKQEPKPEPKHEPEAVADAVAKPEPEEIKANEEKAAASEAEKSAEQNLSHNAEPDADAFDLLSVSTLPSSKKISLKPLRLQKSAKSSLGGISDAEAEEVLPRLTAESIQNIKRKQSAQPSASAASMMERKREILKLRKQRRRADMKAMHIEPAKVKNASEMKSSAKPSTLPPLHKSLFAKIGKPLE